MWPKVRLGDLIRVKHGYAFAGEHFSDLPPGDILVTPGNFNFGGGFNTEKLKYYRGPDVPDFILRAGDLIVTMTDLSKNADTLGLPALIPESHSAIRFLHNQRIGRVDLISDIIDKHFLYYLMRSHSYRAEVLASATGTTVKHTAPVRIEAFSFALPTLAEQHAITSILGALDDKIELNRKMSATLEAIARALFKSWFVDFDPVRAKLEGRDPGLPEKVAALFQGSIQSLHGITFPSEWCLSPLSALSASIQRGISPAYTDVGALVINQKCIRNGHIDLSRARRHNSAIKSVESRLVLRGDVLVNSTGVGTLGRVAQVVALPDGEVTVDSHVSIVRPDPTAVEPIYLGFAMLNLQSEIEMLGEGTTGQTELSRARLGGLMLVTPPKLIQEQYARFVEPLVLKVSKNAQQSETLAALRDALLPKLISGDLRVGDAERVLAASA